MWSSTLLSAQQSSHVCPHDWIRGQSSWTFTSRRTTLWICQTKLSQCLSASGIISAPISSFIHLLVFNSTHEPLIVRCGQSQVLCTEVCRMSNTKKKGRQKLIYDFGLLRRFPRKFTSVSQSVSVLNIHVLDCLDHNPHNDTGLNFQLPSLPSQLNVAQHASAPLSFSLPSETPVIADSPWCYFVALKSCHHNWSELFYWAMDANWNTFCFKTYNLTSMWEIVAKVQ